MELWSRATPHLQYFAFGLLVCFTWHGQTAQLANYLGRQAQRLLPCALQLWAGCCCIYLRGDGAVMPPDQVALPCLSPPCTTCELRTELETWYYDAEWFPPGFPAEAGTRGKPMRGHAVWHMYVNQTTKLCRNHVR
jgi:hypothetical protein